MNFDMKTSVLNTNLVGRKMFFLFFYLGLMNDCVGTLYYKKSLIEKLHLHIRIRDFSRHPSFPVSVPSFLLETETNWTGS